MGFCYDIEEVYTCLDYWNEGMYVGYPLPGLPGVCVALPMNEEGHGR